MKEVIGLIKKGAVGILPTDTLYGLVGLALSKKVVEKIYALKGRSPDKPLIILISSINDLKSFSVQVSSEIEKFLSQVWPGPVSVILPCPDQNFAYLHRDTNSLAFRLPDNKKLQEIIKKTGPLVAPSANLQGEPPAQTIREAEKYFGTKAEFYVDGGKIISLPSTLIKIEDGNIKVIRKGAKWINENSWIN